MWHSSPPTSGITEIVDDVRRPLVGLGQQDGVRVLHVQHLATPLEELVGLRQVLAVGALFLEEVGHRVQSETIEPEVQPESQRIDHLVADGRVLEVQIRLVGEEPVPEILFPNRVEGPVAGFGVHEDDARVRIAGVVVPPDVVVAVRPVRVPAGLLEPLVRIGRVVHDQVDDDPDSPIVCRVEQRDEILDRAELRQHLAVIGDVIPAVPKRRIVERRQPEAVDAQPGQVVELVDQAAQVAGAVAVGVGEGPDQYLVEDRTLVPLPVGIATGDGPCLAVVAGLRFMDDAVIVCIGHAHPFLFLSTVPFVLACRSTSVRMCAARQCGSNPRRFVVPTDRSRRTVRPPHLPDRSSPGRGRASKGRFRPIAGTASRHTPPR